MIVDDHQLIESSDTRCLKVLLFCCLFNRIWVDFGAFQFQGGTWSTLMPRRYPSRWLKYLIFNFTSICLFFFHFKFLLSTDPDAEP